MMLSQAMYIMPEIKLIETNNSVTNCSTLHSNSLQNFRLKSLIFTKIYKIKHMIFGVYTFALKFIMQKVYVRTKYHGLNFVNNYFYGNDSVPLLLPIGAVAFAPFLLLLELVAATVSNAILLALVILACVKKHNNNINIYLFSLALGELVGAVDIFCLLFLIVGRRWVLVFAVFYLWHDIHCST